MKGNLSKVSIAAFAALSLVMALALYRGAKVRLSPEQEPAVNEPLATSTPLPAPPTHNNFYGGGPVGADVGHFTNENQQDFLLEEKKRMGIREILPARASSEEGPPNQPLDRNEAREIIQRMTDQLYNINQRKQSKIPPAIPLDIGSSPRLLAQQQSSRPLEERADESIKSMAPGSVALLTKKAEESADVSVPSVPDALKSASISTLGRRRNLKWKISWSGRTAGIQGPGGARITNSEDWADLWQRLGRSQSRPALDFNKLMVVAVFGGSDPGSPAGRISSMREEGTKLLVRYRNIFGKRHLPAGSLTSYHVVVVSKSTLPIEFQKIP